MSIPETELKMAERHVREAERHVARQRQIVEELRRDGHKTELAETLLGNYAHRQLLAHVRSQQ